MSYRCLTDRPSRTASPRLVPNVRCPTYPRKVGTVNNPIKIEWRVYMSVPINVIRGRGFLRTSTENVVDLAHSKEILLSILTESESPPDFGILIFASFTMAA